MSQPPVCIRRSNDGDFRYEVFDYQTSAFQFGIGSNDEGCVECLFYDEHMESAMTLASVLVGSAPVDNRPRYVEWHWSLPKSITTFDEARKYATEECTRLIDIVRLHASDVSNGLSKLSIK